MAGVMSIKSGASGDLLRFHLPPPAQPLDAAITQKGVPGSPLSQALPTSTTQQKSLACWSSPSPSHPDPRRQPMPAVICLAVHISSPPWLITSGPRILFLSSLPLPLRFMPWPADVPPQRTGISDIPAHPSAGAQRLPTRDAATRSQSTTIRGTPTSNYPRIVRKYCPSRPDQAPFSQSQPRHNSLQGL